MIYTADFETMNNELNIVNSMSRVWLWDICSIDTYTHAYGASIEYFFKHIETLSNAIIYFHNLKFDGGFILDYILKNGYEYVDTKPKKEQFTALITDTKIFYSITVKVGNSKIEFRDSSKKIDGSVEDIAKAYELPILKGSIDYKKFRDTNYTATKEEIAYIHNDTEIIARVLNFMYSKGLDRMTSSGDAFSSYKKMSGKVFDILFPVQDYEIDKFIRKAYKGGVVQVSDKIKGKIINNVYCYDVNSMYPAQMAYKVLPYGDPIYYNGEAKVDIQYKLYIQHIRVCATLKDNFQPTVLVNSSRFGTQEYLRDTDGGWLELWLTSIDLELFKRHYDIWDISYIDGYKFKGSTKLFKSYITPLYELKCTTKGALKIYYKGLLNKLYGKFAVNPKHCKKIPYLKEGKVEYRLGEPTIDDSVYTAVSAFITAYSREYLFNTIQDNYANFVYCDTDSVHIFGEIKNADIDEKKLGYFKLEKVYTKAMYLAQKTYIGDYNDNGTACHDKKICGCPKNVKIKINFNNFEFNSVFTGKLMPKTVNGGVVLVDRTFTIKQR